MGAATASGSPAPPGPATVLSNRLDASSLIGSSSGIVNPPVEDDMGEIMEDIMVFAKWSRAKVQACGGQRIYV